VRLHEHIGNDDFIGKLRMFPCVARIRMVADIKPRPAIKPARDAHCDVVGRQILADLVPARLCSSKARCCRDETRFLLRFEFPKR